MVNKKKALILLPVLLGLLLPSLAMAAPGSTDPSAAQLSAKARAATAKYHVESVAMADGYVPASPCEEVPGIGAMGIHYVNFVLAFDLSVNELTPEILLYVPEEDGPRLVGVEYFVAYVGQPAPILFGRPMDGPMPPHAPGMPYHYDLHVWLWQGNPDGIFEEFNPTVDC